MIKKTFLFLIISILLIVVLLLAANYWVIQSTKAQLYNDISKLPNNKVALVLGTNPKLGSGRTNLYFTTRMDAAALLYKNGKVKHFILSGDNGRKSYNEPEAMQAALIKRGVPEEAMTLDFAGFRTLDSVVRCREIFGQEKFTIISQAFHNSRAVFIADFYGMDVVAFNAARVVNATRKATNREYLARVKAVLDLYILRKSPKFLGKKEEVPI